MADPTIAARVHDEHPTPRLTEGRRGPRVEAATYTLEFPTDRPYAFLEGPNGERWADLFLASSIHTLEALDATASLDAPRFETRPDHVLVIVNATSSAWRARRLLIACHADHVRAWTAVETTDERRITDAHHFGGYYSGHLRWGSGFFQSGAGFASTFNPEPSGPERRAAPAGESQVIDVMGTSVPGKLHWFFTPPPFCYAFSRSSVHGEVAPAASGSYGADQGGTPEPGAHPAAPEAEPAAPTIRELPGGPWLAAGLAARKGAHNFTGFHYDAAEGAFSFRLAYEGHTRVTGAWISPELVLAPAQPDPYAALEWHTAHLARRGLVDIAAREQPAWWSEPIQCGWGAQCALANERGGRAPDYCRQEHYDAFLAALDANGLNPGTLVLDDKWSGAYATCEADPEKWPDLKGWIRAQHERGRKVLLWWKAWDPEGLSAEQCVTNFAGQPVAADPSNPAYEATLRQAVQLMLSADGYDADGFKVDFSARTPSGPELRHHGPEWGVELLHKLLWILFDEAKRVKSDALVMTHAPNPYFATVTDMIRLNDVNTGAPIVPQMRHRARVARAACPNLLVDTDNWPMPNRAAWREYTSVQPELGIPSLYFATRVDGTLEPLEADDYALVRRAWDDWRERAGKDRS